MKLPENNNCIAVVMDPVETTTAGGIEMVRKFGALTVHAGKKRIATVVNAPAFVTRYKNRVGQSDLPIRFPCPVVAGDRVILTKMAGVVFFDYLGKRVVLVRDSEIHGILDDCPAPEDFTDYIAKVAEYKEFELPEIAPDHTSLKSKPSDGDDE